MTREELRALAPTAVAACPTCEGTGWVVDPPDGMERCTAPGCVDGQVSLGEALADLLVERDVLARPAEVTCEAYARLCERLGGRLGGEHDGSPMGLLSATAREVGALRCRDAILATRGRP